MSSLLIISPVESLQDNITGEIKKKADWVGIYVGLNKTQKSTEDTLKKNKIDTSKLFFIDLVTTEKTREDVLHIRPDQLDLLGEAITTFIRDIEGNKFIVVDALSTLLIYNSENVVAKFVKDITDQASSNNVQVIAFTPKTVGEELLNKIFNFFDDVKGR
jgi:archaellum biogenesis ATPase FlaH